MSSMSVETRINCRTAEDSDAEAISELLIDGSLRGLTLPRTPAEVRAQRADFVVACREALSADSGFGDGFDEAFDPIDGFADPGMRGAPAESSGPLGCGALQVVIPTLGEVRSIAVSPAAKGLGVGRVLVEALMERAPALGVETLVLLTKVPRFFERLGFERAEARELPPAYRQKVLLSPGRTFKGRTGMCLRIGA